MADGGFGPDGYDARPIGELFELYTEAADVEFAETLEPYEGSTNRSLFKAFARAVHENQEQDLESLYDSMFVGSAEGQELTDLARQYGAVRQPAVAATGVVEWTRSSAQTGNERVVRAGTRVTTESPDEVAFELLEPATFSSTDTTAQSSVQAVEPGTVGNVGADRITVMPSPPAGVTGATNPNPTGDPAYTLTDGTTQQRLGQEREDDESLRERVLEGASIGGAATVRAVSDRIRQLEGNPTLTVYTNRQPSDNANGNGVPALSTELVIWAPSATDVEVANAIHESVSIGQKLVGGINGQSASYDVGSSVLTQTRTIRWTEPTEITLSLSLDLVISEGYAGAESVEMALAEYIGGTTVDGSPVAGLSVGDDVIVDELERRVNSLDGVVGTATITIDADGDGNDDTTTRSDGLAAYEVAPDEVATVDATSDITITTTTL